MPDENTIAIGAMLNDGNGSSSGHVRVFVWDGLNWTQKGSDIDGTVAGDATGGAISMPDANTIAIGAHPNDFNGANAGEVRIFEWNGTNWIQKGVSLSSRIVPVGLGPSAGGRWQRCYQTCVLAFRGVPLASHGFASARG